jgi:hypothetical protein
MRRGQTLRIRLRIAQQFSGKHTNKQPTSSTAAARIRPLSWPSLPTFTRKSQETVFEGNRIRLARGHGQFTDVG